MRRIVDGSLEIRLRDRIGAARTMVDYTSLFALAMFDYACDLGLQAIGCLRLLCSVSSYTIGVFNV